MPMQMGLNLSWSKLLITKRVEQRKLQTVVLHVDWPVGWAFVTTAAQNNRLSSGGASSR